MLEALEAGQNRFTEPFELRLSLRDYYASVRPVEPQGIDLPFCADKKTQASINCALLVICMLMCFILDHLRRHIQRLPNYMKDRLSKLAKVDYDRTRDKRVLPNWVHEVSGYVFLPLFICNYKKDAQL